MLLQVVSWFSGMPVSNASANNLSVLGSQVVRNGAVLFVFFLDFYGFVEMPENLWKNGRNWYCIFSSRHCI